MLNDIIKRVLSRLPRYTCCKCGKEIKDHVYQVQRRTIRPVQHNADGTAVRHDGVHTWHDGVILGPETDTYCLEHFKSLPSIEELLNDYKASLPVGSM